MRSRLVLLVVLAALSVPSAPAFAQDGQPCNEPTYAPSKGDLSPSQNPVPLGHLVRLSITDEQSQFVEDGSFVVTIAGPDGTRQVTGDSGYLDFTPAAEGSYTATAHYRVLTCIDQGTYADASAGPTSFTVRKQAVAPAAAPLPRRCYSNSESSSSSQDVECDYVRLPDLAGVVSALAPGTMLPTRVPAGASGADVFKPDAAAYKGEPKTGIGIHYLTPSVLGGSPAGVSFAAFRSTSVRHVRTGLLRDLHRSVHRAAGDRLRVHSFRAGRFRGTLVAAFTAKPPGKSYFTYRDWYYVWSSGGITYLLHAGDTHPHPLTFKVGGIIASFATAS